MTIVTTVDLYETGVATVTNYTTAGAASTPIKIHDADTFAIIVLAGASQAVDFKVQINNSVVVPSTDVEATAGWADYVVEEVVSAGANSAKSYANQGFMWVRIIQQLDTSTDDITWGISTTRQKPGY